MEPMLTLTDEAYQLTLAFKALTRAGEAAERFVNAMGVAMNRLFDQFILKQRLTPPALWMLKLARFCRIPLLDALVYIEALPGALQ